MPDKHVLITNDDGIDAYGLRVLTENITAIEGLRVSVVAPSDQQSATSHSLTLTAPVRVIERGPGRYAVTGTPTDAVLMAFEQILRNDPPDIVLSGINHGPNMGEDVLYSGTVAAAMEGAMFNVPSYALSLATWHPSDFSGAAAFVRRFLPQLLEFPLRKHSLLNINIPDGPEEKLRGVKVARLGSRVYHDIISDHRDPRGRPYYWIGGRGPTWEEESDTDHAVLKSGYVAITPLIIDITHRGLLGEMDRLNCEGLPGESLPETRKYRLDTRPGTGNDDVDPGIAPRGSGSSEAEAGGGAER